MSTDSTAHRYSVLEETRIGDYIIESFIGAGGQAVVYLARHMHTGARRALKIFGLTGSGIGAMEAGVSEAKKATNIHHHSVMTLYDPGTAETDFEGSIRQVLYIPMQLSVLGNCEANPPFKGRPLSVPDFKTMLDLLDGLTAIHENDIIHDDIKPANILRFEEKLYAEMRTVLRITDFGIARVLSAIGQSDPSAMTFHYAAPERFLSKRFLKSDVYSMGATLFYMITGKHPVIAEDDGPDPTLSWRRAHESNPRPDASKDAPSCPTRLSLLLVRMMNPDPAERPDLDECKKQLHLIIDSIKGKEMGYPIPYGLNKELSRRQFPAVYVAEFQGIFNPLVHKLFDTHLYVIRIKMGHLVFSEYKRLIEFLVRRFSDSFCLYETWGMYDISMFMWNKPNEIDDLQASLEEQFPGSEVDIHKADGIHHFHKYDYSLPGDADRIYALAVQESIHLHQVDRRLYLVDGFKLIPEDSIRAFIYIESSEHNLRRESRRTIISSVRDKMAEMMEQSSSSSTPRFHRISMIELSPGPLPTVLVVEFVVSHFRYLSQIPTAIIGLDLRVKTSTFIATGRIVIQSNKILFE